MIFLKNYFINTTEELDVISVVHEVRAAVRESGTSDGLVTVLIPEQGAGIVLMEPLSDVVAKLKESVEIFPGKDLTAKNRFREEVDLWPRIAAAMLGRSLGIPLHGGNLMTGHREEPLLIDMTRRISRREILVQVMGEAQQAQQGMPGRGAMPQQR